MGREPYFQGSPSPAAAKTWLKPWPSDDASPWSALALPEPAVFDPVAAGGHVTPGTGPAVGAVVEGPPAIGVAAGLQPSPGAVALCIADDQQQGHQPGFERGGGLCPEDDLPARPDLQRGPGGLGGGLEGLQIS